MASTKVGKIEEDTSPLYPSDFNNLEELRKKALSSARECVELAAAYVSIAKGILK